MLCSVSELGLGEEADGIITFVEGKPGTAFADHYKNADIVFELNVTPNRADCLSHMGLARELSTLLDRPIKVPNAEIKEGEKEISHWIDVQLIGDKACPRYCGRMICGVKVGESPEWLKSRLEAVGVNSINNIVDITNYVLFEYGQPLHAFDYKELQNQTILIEHAKPGEKFTTLDGSEISLRESDLLIRDGARAVALGGVVGGLNSGVTETTQDIFLESAFFTAEGVRKTSRYHGIETDACYRFSRGVDPEQTINAMNRAASLMVELAGGEVQKGHVDLYPSPLSHNDIKIEASYVGQRLGLGVSDNDFETWMKRLNCIVAKKGNDFRVTPPSYRWDLKIPEDLVEEYGRLHGYEHIGESLPTLHSEPTTHNFDYSFDSRVANILVGLGCYQAFNYEFIGKGQSLEIWGSSEGAKTCGLTVADQGVALQNPLSEELNVMRESLLPAFLKNVIYNNHHGNHWGRIFEIGATHFNENGKYCEERKLAFAFWGSPENLWASDKKSQVVFSLKSTIESLLTKLGGKNWRWQKMSTSPPGFHPGQTVTLWYEGKVIGCLGSMHPKLLGKNKIRTEVAWAELNFSALGVRQPRTPKFLELPKYPGVERDIAFLSPDNIAADQMAGEIRKSAGPLLASFEVFDVYQDKDLKAAGQKSVAFRLHFQSDKETLSDEQVNGLRDRIVNSLCQKLGLEIR